MGNTCESKNNRNKDIQNQQNLPPSPNFYLLDSLAEHEGKITCLKN